MSFEDILDGLRDSFDSGRQGISQEELEAQKVDPKDVSLPTIAFSRRQIPEIRLPEVAPPTGDRTGRKLAEAEKRRQWEMKTKVIRTIAVNESIVAVNVHAVTQMERAQAMMMDNLYGHKRRESMNDFMARFTAQCLQLTQSEILAVIESYLKRISEDL